MTSDAYDAAGDLGDELEIAQGTSDEEQAGGWWPWTLPGGTNGLICTISFECTLPHLSCGR